MPTNYAQPQTDTDTFDNAPPADAVTVKASGIKRVIIRENAGANTTSYKVFEPKLTSGFVTREVGKEFEFTKPGGATYEPGEICGYVLLLDVASAVFSHEEKGS